MSDWARLALLGGGVRGKQVSDALNLGQVQLPQLRAPDPMHRADNGQADNGQA